MGSVVGRRWWNVVERERGVSEAEMGDGWVDEEGRGSGEVDDRRKGKQGQAGPGRAMR